MKKRMFRQLTAGLLALVMLLEYGTAEALAAPYTGTEYGAETEAQEETGAEEEKVVHGMDQDLPYGTAEDPEAEYIIAEEVKKREAGMKYFLTERNGHVAVLYPEPVHYQTDDGWEEIDNRLVLTEDAGTGEEAYENAASDVKVSLARYSDAEELVSLEWDGRRISWSLVTEPEEDENGEETEPSGETAAEEPSGQKENAETAAEKPSRQKEKTEAAAEEPGEKEEAAAETAGSKHGEPAEETVKETTEPEQGETVKESEEQGEPADEPAGKPAETQKPEIPGPGSRSQSSGQAVKPARREFLPQTPLYETEEGGESSSHGAGVSDEAGEDDTAVSPAGSILPEIPEGWPEIPVPDEWKKVTKERDGLAADRYNAQVAGVPNLSSGGIYQEVFPGIDLQYRIDSVTLKENIFLNDRDAAGQTIRFRIHHPGMRMVLSGEGEVQLVTGEGEGEAYTFLRPYMYDAAGETSNAVSYELLEDGEDETILTVSAD
ncbi:MULTISPECIES: hypothetical protein [unclassified Candidatus Paralachnospira]|uniref:hypothetical protein n=1 Tax=unclassified Candidatus Paralachnospira TaxID=3099471 RepID=UPI003F9386DE